MNMDMDHRSDMDMDMGIHLDRTCRMDMYKDAQPGYGHAIWTWSRLAGWIWTFRMDMDMQHRHGHAAWTCMCSEDLDDAVWMDVQHGHGRAA